MKTKHLFYTLAVSAAFAACSQEEIVSQQEIASADLSNRPVVGKVALNFGEAESRGTVADRAFNAIDFVKGVDGFGARIIDTYSPLKYTRFDGIQTSLPSGYTLDHAWRNYEVTDAYASSNYKYVNNGGAEWITDALMVEGNYMFYYPYNEANLARTPNKVVLPMTQVVKPSEEDGYRNPIKDLYEGENPAIVGYAFLSATDQDATVKPELNHIFAYPQFTIKNEQTKKVSTGWWQTEEEVDLLIEKIEISSKYFVKNYEIKHSGVEANLRDFALAEQKKGSDKWAKSYKAGDWTDATTLLKNAVSEDILEPKKNDQVDGKIVVEFEGGLYLPYGEEYSFNVVMPAAKYNDEKELNFTIYLADNKQIDGVQKVDPNNYTYLTYAPGKRFASEEYDYPKNGTPTVKGSAGALGTITLKGETIIDKTPATQIIDNAEEFEAYLASIVDNTAPLQEVYNVAAIKKENQFVLARNTKNVASMKIDAAVVELINTYLNEGSVEFYSTMQVEDAEEVVVLNNMKFNAGVNVLAGDVVAEGVIAEKVIVSDGTLTIPADNNNAIGNIEVNAGEVIVKENYLSTYNTITIGNTVVDGEVVATGKLTIDGEISGINLGYVTMNDGDIVIAEKSSAIVGTNATGLTAGTITVDGTLEVKNAFTVPADVTVDVNGTLKTTADLTNNGTITTDKSLVIAENNGTITPSSEKITLTVNGGNGTINNTALAKVTGTNNNTIYAEVPSIAFMKQANFKVGANINKIVVTGALDVETQSFTLQTGITVVEFKGGSLYVAGDLYFNFNNAAVVINADTEWNGRNDIYSNHMKNIDSISVKADEDGEYYSFTYNGIAVEGVTYVANL